ncbi:alpha/beta hydrolase, partial [Buchananella hordeovulneris]|uniref:alpha/beta hydrolase n=1 Tax=Buchananella hordeovulneris TaxID=52770 RepID=UPI000FAEA3F7
YGLVEKLGEVMLATSEMSDAVWGLQQEVLECEQYARINELHIDGAGTVMITADMAEMLTNPTYMLRVNELRNAQEALAERVAGVLRRADEADRAYQARLRAITQDTYRVVEKGRTGTQGLPDLPGKDWGPTQVAAWWEALGDADKEEVIAEHSELIGNLDGIDMASRSKANKQRLPDLLTEEEERLADLEARFDAVSRNYLNPLSQQDIIELGRERAIARQRVKDLRYLNDHVLEDPSRSLVTMDTSGERVKAAVAQGDVDRAKHVAVFTPGIGSKVAGMEGYLKSMGDLRQTASDVGNVPEDEMATVMWLGYQAPRGFGENGGFAEYSETRLADRGADELSSYLEGIQASREASGAGDPHLTALGHSYGSTTTGMAAARVRPGVVDDLVLFGSPGAGVYNVEEYNVPQGHAWVSGVRGGDAVQGLGLDSDFGRNPMGMDGFTPLSNEAPDPRTGILDFFGRHSVYLEPGSGTLKDFGRVVAGAK